MFSFVQGTLLQMEVFEAQLSQLHVIPATRFEVLVLVESRLESALNHQTTHRNHQLGEVELYHFRKFGCPCPGCDEHYMRYLG